MMSDWIFTWKSSTKNIGDKKNYPGTNAWFIIGNLEICWLKPSRKIKLLMQY
jgi:hypothetical protein